jgi:MscS family membrane protein
VSVPNCIIAHGPIENFSERKKMLYHPELHLRYDTTAEQIENIMDNITAMAQNNERVIADSVRVVFTEFAQNAMILKARIYVNESDFGAYLAVVTELNLEIMKIVQNAGTQFAQGAQTVMLEQTKV